MSIRKVTLSLLASTALGGAVAFPAAAQNADPVMNTPPSSQPQAQAQPQPPAHPTQLDAVTTAATRTKRPIDAVPGTVSIITSEEIDRDNMQNMRDLVRNEPGVSISTQPARGGNTNFIIRGIGGNRVLVMTDGVRLPDFPGSNAGAGTYTRDFVDLESIKRVEIIRGPVSVLYGSDALGGVVAYTTKDPSDYLVPGGPNSFASVKGAYSGADNSFTETLTGAIRHDKVEFLGLYTRRDGHEVVPAASSLGPNPTSYSENSFLAKLVLRPTDADTFRVIGEYLDRRQTTQVLSNVGDFPSLVAKIYDEWGADRTQRYRISGQWVHDEPFMFVDRLDLLVYFTALNRQEDTVQLRGANNGVIPSNFRASSFLFAQTLSGAELQLNSNVKLFNVPNLLTYGLSFSYTTTSRPRDRTQVTLATGVANKTSGGETFPNKNFPDTTTVQGGIYLQDEILAGPLTVMPAVRLDYYSLTPNPDADFWRSSGAINVLPSASTYVSVSPKLGAIYRFTDEYSAFAQYARGFRAPPYDNANFGFNNLSSFYQILPNGNLKPESSDSFEAGVRGKFASGSSFSLTAFYNLYNNFIDTAVVGMVGPITQFQYINLPSATIWGFEARGEWQFTPEWAVLGNFAFARGINNANGLPIDSVDPWKVRGSIRYGTGVGFGAQINNTVASQHDQISVPSYFQTPAYYLLDATISYNWNPHFQANLGLFNITNAKYFNSQDVIGVAWNSIQLDRYAQPGRYVGVNLTAKW